MARAFGQISTSAVTRVPIAATAYTEQASGAQRALKSSSANDAAAGTGVRQVVVTYFTWDGTTMIGPLVETVTLNGTTAVPMVATGLAFVESMVAVSAGSGGAAAGIISLAAAADGSGATIASIAAGAVRTFLGHHYVASKRACRITDLMVTGGNATAANVELNAQTYPNGIEQPLTGGLGAIGAASGAAAGYALQGLRVDGPARIRAYVTPGSATAQSTFVSIGFVDELVSF
jgi:hypothetical protein